MTTRLKDSGAAAIVTQCRARMHAEARSETPCGLAPMVNQIDELTAELRALLPDDPIRLVRMVKEIGWLRSGEHHSLSI